MELIGRDDELRSVERVLDGIGSGSRALLIEGEAGAGKTSVWQAALEAATARGQQVLVARPVEAETSFAFAALGDLLHGRLAGADRLAAPQRRALEVALLVAEDAEAAPDQQAVALAVLALVRSVAGTGPVVVAVDDVQWLDAPSAAVLRFVARRLGDVPLGLVLSVRTAGEAEPPLGLDRAFPDDRLTRLRLAPLSMGAIQRLLRTRLKLVMPRTTLQRLHELSAGNPFFALELGRALQAGTVRLEREERLPVTLDALVRDRLGALSRESQHALTVAAALAQPTAVIVHAVTGDGELEEAERAQVVEIQSGRVRFAHPLLASGAYGLADPAQRRDIHARLGELVDDPEERARHLALAAPGPDAAVAAMLDEAAERAQSRGAPAAAAELYERAIRLTPPDDVVAAHRRTADTAYCLFLSGDSRRARAMLDGVVEELGPGPERAHAMVRLARVRSYDDDLRAAEALYVQAVDEAGDDVVRAWAHDGVAGALFRLRERLPTAVEHGRAAVAAADQLGDDAWRAECLGTRLLAESALGDADAPTTLEAALALQDRCDHRRVMAQPLFQAGVFWFWTDQLERARSTFMELARRAREMGEEGSLPYVLALLAQIECFRGEPAAAARATDEGHEITERAGQAWVGAYVLAVRALADAIAGDGEGARQRGERALAVSEETVARPPEQFAASALGLLDLSVGRSAGAAEVLGPRVDFVRAQGIAEPGAARFVPDHIEALIELGDTASAIELLGWYERNAQRLERASALAIAARCRSLLAAGDGDLDAAVEAGERALALHEGVPIPLERGRTLLAHGITHRRAKHKRLAREALEEAQRIFDGMGARLWAERARAELSRIGGRAPATGELTPTERRVAELVAEGMATKQVAAALFVSPKTVEGHLSNIYAKLDVHSRTELAHRLRE